MDATETLARYADAVTTHDWDAVAALLTPGFVAELLHSGETFDGPAFVAFNRGYPGPWTFVAEETVGAGSTAVLRARVESGPSTYHVASFGSVDEAGLLVSLREVWAGPEERHHLPDRVEIDVPDLRAAQDFYAAAFGWSFTEREPGRVGIRAPSGRGEIGELRVGGPDRAPLVLLRSEDLDATAATVRAAGGTITEGPTDVTAGRRFLFTDPGGIAFGVHTDA